MNTLQFPERFPGEQGFEHFFGTRQSPAPLINKIQVGCKTSVLPHYPCVMSLKQVHGTNVVVVTGEGNAPSEGVQEGDALVTNQTQVLLIVRTADCVPVLLADLKQKVVAAVHAGWRGAVAGIVPETLAVMRDQFGTDPRDVQAAVGPSIGVCCFEVDEPVLKPLKANFPFWSDVLTLTSEMRGKLDLKALVVQQLVSDGVSHDAISQSHDCTHCQADQFFSYRREGQVNGTMLSGIMVHH